MKYDICNMQQLNFDNVSVIISYSTTLGALSAVGWTKKDSCFALTLGS